MAIPNQCMELRKHGAEFLQSEELCDCWFLVGTKPHQEVIASFKMLLSMASPVFKAMFYGLLSERTQQIPISDMEPEDFRAVLSYIYTNDVNISSVDQACGLYYGAKKYMLTHLEEECSKYLQLRVSVSNALCVYEYAIIFEDDKLINKTTQIITKNTKAVLSNPSFEKAELSTIIHFFSLDELNIDSEIDLFESLVRYINVRKKNTSTDVTNTSSYLSEPKEPQTNKNEENIDQIMVRNILKVIRFLCMTSKQFADGPAKSELLSEADKLTIFMNLSSKDTNVSMPNGFSIIRDARKEKVVKKYEKDTEQRKLKIMCPNLSDLWDTFHSVPCIIKGLGPKDLTYRLGVQRVRFINSITNKVRIDLHTDYGRPGDFYEHLVAETELKILTLKDNVVQESHKKIWYSGYVCHDLEVDTTIDRGGSVLIEANILVRKKTVGCSQKD